MDFSGQYLTYQEYKSLGGTLDLTPFNLLEYKAQKVLDEATLGKLKNLNSQRQEVKLCIKELMDKINAQDEHKNISSESVGSYSVSYTNSTDYDNELNYIIADYLFDCKTPEGIPYLYRGV